MIERLITNSLPSPLSERFLSRFFVGLARCVVLFQPFTQPLRSATRCRTGPYRNVVLVRLDYSSAPTRHRQSKTTKNRCRKRLLKKAPTRTVQVVLERQGADKTKREHAEEFWCLGGGHQITISPAFDRAVASASSGGCRFFCCSCGCVPYYCCCFRGTSYLTTRVPNSLPHNSRWVLPLLLTLLVPV